MIIRVLPNRQIVAILTPREASMIEEEILDPGDFPWQSSESQMIAMGFKMQLHQAVVREAAEELDKSLSTILQMAALREEAEKAAERPPEDTPRAAEEPGIEPPEPG